MHRPGAAGSAVRAAPRTDHPRDAIPLPAHGFDSLDDDVRELATRPGGRDDQPGRGDADERGRRELGLAPGEEPDIDLDEARRLITALAGCSAASEEFLGTQREPLRDGLRTLQRAFREASAYPDAAGRGAGRAVSCRDGAVRRSVVARGQTGSVPRFSPATQAWLDGAFDAPTAAQAGAWDAIARGEHTLVVAPTGSGKTLAAFLSALDRLAAAPVPDDPQRRCRVLYVSPLKALAVDVERNLRAPLAGIRQAAARLGLPAPGHHRRDALRRHPGRRAPRCSPGARPTS